MNEQRQRREIEEVLVAQATSDGDGVQLKRVFGGGDLARFDPFLMLDEFGSDKAADYIGGFPPHPHRGFEIVTYMLAGQMEHRDHMGNVGRLGPGDVQWMDEGRLWCYTFRNAQAGRRQDARFSAMGKSACRRKNDTRNLQRCRRRLDSGLRPGWGQDKGNSWRVGS